MEARPVGGQWLKEHFNLVNFTMTHASYIAGTPAIRMTSKGNVEENFIYRYAPAQENVLNHIEFYLKYDDINLDFLQSVFQKVSAEEILAFINTAPASKQSRKIGFLYEFLTDTELNLKRAVSANYTDLLDTEKYVTGQIQKDARWRINNNLLGNRDYCPIVRRTRELNELIAQDLTEKILELKAEYPDELFTRATTYLYTKETKSSYEIEKENPSPDRTQKFVALLRLAGTERSEDMLDPKRLIALQNAIVDSRFASTDFRNFQNYVGQSMGNGYENFHYICPPPQIIQYLMKGLQALAFKSSSTATEIRAALIAFGFVFIHPFDDGNGRLHRFLIHDVLVHDKKVPEGIIIPVSAHMLNNMRAYDDILEKYSRPLMQRIKFTTSDTGEVEIINVKDVEGYFKYPDLTDQCVYLANTIHNTIKDDMPKELSFMQRFDEARKAIQQIVDMPDRMLSLMLTILYQNKGVLSKKRRKDFTKLTDEEIDKIQEVYKGIYELT